MNLDSNVFSKSMSLFEHSVSILQVHFSEIFLEFQIFFLALLADGPVREEVFDRVLSWSVWFGALLFVVRVSVDEALGLQHLHKL